MKKRFLLTIEYDGRGYSGWQRQKNGVSIQAVIEDVLSQVLGHEVVLFGSGRTDAGVSARCQTAHFDTDTAIPPCKVPYAANSLLPQEISILECISVADDFHARFLPKKKTYVYKLYFSKIKRPLLDRERLWIKPPLDIGAMKRAAEYMVGKYDCKCFQKEGSPSGDTIKHIHAVKVEARCCDDTLVEVDISMTGSGFLYKMARTMAGTLLYVGIGKLTPDDVKQAVTFSDKSKTGKTLRGEYLLLENTEYASLADE